MVRAFAVEGDGLEGTGGGEGDEGDVQSGGTADVLGGGGGGEGAGGETEKDGVEGGEDDVVEGVAGEALLKLVEMAAKAAVRWSFSGAGAWCPSC